MTETKRPVNPDNQWLTPTQRLKTFLHFGSNDRTHNPNNYHFKDQSFLVSVKDSALLSVIEKIEAEDVYNIILKVYSDGYSIYPKMFIAALAVCIQRPYSKQPISRQMRDAGYKAAKIICSSNENFLNLLNFINVRGRAFKKFVKDWYWSKDVKTLAEIVGKNKKLFGISHKRIVQRSHLKPNGPGMAAILKYLLFGIKAAKKEFEDNPEANEALNYLQIVEDFRRMKDEQQAARYIEMYHFTLDHVPSHLLKSKEVWSALIGNLPLPVLLQNLQRIGRKGFLQPNSVLVDKIIDALNDETAIAESQIHPAHVFMELRNYQCSSKILAAEKARMKKMRLAGFVGMVEKSKKRARPVPNPKIISALYDLFATTCKLFLAPTGLRYSVTIDLKSLKSTDLCHGLLCVSPVQAAAIISLCLLHADRNVAIHTCNQSQELVPLSLTSEMTIQDTIKTIKQARMHRVELPTPIDWALKNKQEHDVFVVLTDSLPKYNNINVTVKKYRDEMNIPNAKFIVVYFIWEAKRCYSITEWRNDAIPEVFAIFGFDKHTPRLIEAFSRGAF